MTAEIYTLSLRDALPISEALPRLLRRIEDAARGLDLRKPLREGASAEELRALITSAWGGRTDRGAEERLAVRERAPLVPLTELKADPHLEMHTRGG